MKKITRRGALKLLIKAATVAVVGVAMPSVLMAETIQKPSDYDNKKIPKHLYEDGNHGPYTPLRSGYLRVQPFHPVKGNTITVTGTTNFNGEWVMIDGQTMRPVK